MPGANARRALPAIVAGVVVGFVNIVKTMALAGLIYSGPLAPAFLVGLSAVLVGAGVSIVAVSALTENPAVLGAALASTGVVYALIPPALFPGAVGAATLAHDPLAAARLVAVVSGGASILAGTAFWLLGRYRLGAVARFLPYPVVAGFNAGIGWLFLLGGVALGADLHPGAGWVHLADPSVAERLAVTVAIAVLMLVIEARAGNHWAVMPGVLAIAILSFHLGRLALGETVHQVAASGWMLGPFRPGRILTFPDWHALSALNGARLGAITPAILTVVLVGTVSSILLITGIEVEIHQTLDTDHELRVAGVATIGAGLFGGLVGGPSLISTSVGRRMRQQDRIVGIVAGLLCAGMLLAGTNLLNVLPRFAVASVLVSTGLDRLIDRAWKTRRSLPWTEWTALLLVLATVIWNGLLAGVVMGLALTLAIFVWNYRRVPVIRLAASGNAHRSTVIRAPADEALLRRDGDAIRLLRLQGYLFFLNAVALLEALPAAGARFLILDFRAVTGLDSSAGMTLRRSLQIAAERGYAVQMTGLPPPMRTQFARMRIPLATGGAPEATTEDQALQYAENRVLAAEERTGPAEVASFAEMFAAIIGHPIAETRLAPYLKRQSFPSGAALIRQGDPAETMCFIAAGRVRVQLDRPGASPLPLASAGPGVVVGEIGFYLDVPRTATVLAEADTEALVLDRATLTRMEREDPELAIDFHRLMTCMVADKLAGSTRQQAQNGT